MAQAASIIMRVTLGARVADGLHDTARSSWRRARPSRRANRIHARRVTDTARHAGERGPRGRDCGIEVGGTGQGDVGEELAGRRVGDRQAVCRGRTVPAAGHVVVENGRRQSAGGGHGVIVHS
jgi:hypothetical protein